MTTWLETLAWTWSGLGAAAALASGSALCLSRAHLARDLARRAVLLSLLGFCLCSGALVLLFAGAADAALPRLVDEALPLEARVRTLGEGLSAALSFCSFQLALAVGASGVWYAARRKLKRHSGCPDTDPED